MIAGQHHTGMFDFIQTYRLLNLAIEHEEAVFGFLIGANFQQDQIAHNGVVDFSIIKCLIRVIYRLGIDPLTTVRVIFNFNRQVTANGFNKDKVFD